MIDADFDSMKIRAEIQMDYKEEKKAEIVFKSLEVDNEGFLLSSIEGNIVDFTISSDSLGTFLSTLDDLIFSELTIEKVLESNLNNNHW
ncbi:MAG: hypothetical protein LBC39_03310 [Methanobrevibacter sp.]|jgi:hypothetical protein|nr:hypothetical protein [Candidatus Methanovirga aequatorialis]